MAAKALLAASCLLSAAFAEKTYLGFSTGAFYPNNTAKVQADYEKEFSAAASLAGSPGVFSSIRLYTNIQFGTDDTPSEAFAAAVATNTSMLLGIWASGTTSIDNELSALKSAISMYGDKFTDLVIAVSVGSEDLYRQSAPGLMNKAGVGNTPGNIKNFIQQTKSALSGTPLSTKPVGHVDTFDQFANSSNDDALNAADFWGVNAFPYYQTETGNAFSNATTIFSDDWNTVLAAAKSHGNKDVWLTETGWPYVGPLSGLAVASVDNAKAYWDNVGCGMLFGKVNTWWYALVDGNPANKEQFDITDNASSTPRFNLTCPAPSATQAANSSSTAASTPSSTSKPSSASGFSASLPAALLSSAVGLLVMLVM